MAGESEPGTTPTGGPDIGARPSHGLGAKRARSMTSNSSVEDDDLEGSFHTASRSASMEPDRKIQRRHPQDTTRTKAALPGERGHILPPKPSSICQLCWDGPIAAQYGLFEEGEDDPLPWNWVDGYSYSTSWAALKIGADAGCAWCQLVYATRRCRDDKDEDSDDHDEEDEHDEVSSAAPVSVRVGNGGPLLNFSPEGTQTIYVCVDDEPYFGGYVYAAADDPAAQHIVARLPILDVASSHALSLAKAYIDDCVQGHQSCVALTPLSPDPLLPTRLVDCTDLDHPRLVTTNGRRGKYLALSYVWGEPQPHHTVMENVSAYADGIELLPQTIRDAIQVTHALGFQYLWADSLCIIQDSDDDKRHELGRMHRIYRDAYLTIIAASAHKVSEGFLHVRPAAPWSRSTTFPQDIALPFLCPPLPVHASSPGADSEGTPELPTATLGQVFVCPTYTRAEDRITTYSHAWEPISARGWCLQEYLMSPRALVYTSQTLQFRCQTATQNIGRAAHEAGTECWLPDALFRADADSSTRPSSSTSTSRSGPEWLDLRKAWQNVVQDYTRRTVGVPADKLVACGAIATAFQGVLRTDYLAGLWRDTLLVDLLWYKERGADVDVDVPRPRAYRAPSWSWAAVDGKVTLEHGMWLTLTRDLRPGADTNAVAEVVQCEVSFQDAALPFGQVTGGSLTLRAGLVRCVLGVEEGVLRLRLQSAAVEQVEDGVRVDGAAAVDSEVHSEHAGWAYLDSDADMDVARTWAVPLMRDEVLTVGLVVTLVTDPTGSDSGADQAGTLAGRRVFRRVGYFDLSELDGRGLCRALEDREVAMSEIELV